jgi:hypothetical protein
MYFDPDADLDSSVSFPSLVGMVSDETMYSVAWNDGGGELETPEGKGKTADTPEEAIFKKDRAECRYMNATTNKWWGLYSGYDGVHNPFVTIHWSDILWCCCLPVDRAAISAQAIFMGPFACREDAEAFAQDRSIPPYLHPLISVPPRMALPDCQQRNISVEWADVDTDSVPPVAVVVLQRRKLLETDENNLRVGSRDSPRVKVIRRESTGGGTQPGV